MPSAVAAASEMVLSPIVKSSASSITTSAAAASSSSSSSSSVRLSHFAVSSRRSEPKLQLHRWPTSPVAFKRFATAHLPTSPVQVLKQSFLDDASDDNQSEPEVSTASTTVVVNSPRGSSISTNSSTSRCVTPTHELSISSLWKRRLKSPKDNELADSVHHHLHLHHGHTDLGQQQPLHHVVSSTPERKSLGSTIDLADSRSALAKIRVHVKSIESLVTPNINAPVLTEGLEREAALARASIYEELDEFRHNLEDKVKIFPEYLSTKEKALVKQVAESLRLACQIGESTVSVFKTGPFDNASLHLSSARAAARGRSASESVVNDEVFVDVPSLAQHGKDGFIARLRLRRLNSGGGIRRNMLWDVAETATTDGKADRVSEAGGGVYTVSRSSGETLAMFKPAEEEKFVREGIFPGEGAVREEVAYVLDSRSNGFSGVPATAVARLQVSNAGHARPGAVQRYMMGSIGSMEGFGMPFDLAKATAFVPVEQVHRIALLDIRTFNTDRHPGNILLIGDKAPYTMVPIDHGCILPSWFHLSEARFDWIDYPQCKVPLSESGRAYVEALDANADAQMLRKLGIREECVTTLKICTMLLKIATNAGRSLHWMAGFMQRSGCFENPSDLELVVQQACQLSGIPFSFATNEFGEQKPEIPHGILSRRPPSVFFKHLETLLVDAVRARESV